MEHTPPKLILAAEDYLGNESCGCCGSWHPAHFSGDCRDDSNRFNSPEELAALWLSAQEMHNDVIRLRQDKAELVEFVRDIATGKHGFGGQTHRAVAFLNKLEDENVIAKATK